MSDGELDSCGCDPCREQELDFTLAQFKIIAMIALAIGLIAALFIVDPGARGH